ncbi:AIM32 [Candida theae]|uniref:Altered inheritance of mitochondria protein 32 n=1 Tax=Candida theae TaxID=1198502 RepID=A0AAD5FWW0_9ASCO|nr:AIM32 [Candida theae]KAI5950225.1 AIM32 [Candida theae]
MIRLHFKRLFSKLRQTPIINWKLIDPRISIQQDCAFCQSRFPQDKQINFDQDLGKSAAIPSKHVMVLTTKHNRIEEFESRIEKWSGTLAHEVNKLHFKIPMGSRTLISSIVLHNNEEVLQQYEVNRQEGDQLVFIYPEMKIVKFNISHTDQFMTKYLKSEQEEEVEVFNPFAKPQASSKNRVSKIKVNNGNFQEWQLDKDLVVICGHAKRDMRCGVLGPLLVDKFNTELSSKALHDDVYVGEITHVGGHAFAGNVLYYPKECATSHDFIWYGRVFPDHVERIVDDTILNKEIIKGLFRGDCESYNSDEVD